MALLASTVLVETKGLLNDLGGAIYADTAMWPLMNKAYRELQNKLTAYGIGTTKEVNSNPITITAGTTSMVDGGTLPADLILPKEVKERRAGSTDLYVDLTDADFEPLNLPAKTYLGWWSWREDEIKFPAATEDREILIRYVKGFAPIVQANSPVLIINSQQWLAQRTAAIAAMFIGGNPTRANALSADLKELWDDLIQTAVKKKQTTPVRRRRTRYRRP